MYLLIFILESKTTVSGSLIISEVISILVDNVILSYSNPYACLNSKWKKIKKFTEYVIFCSGIIFTALLVNVENEVSYVYIFMSGFCGAKIFFE